MLTFRMTLIFPAFWYSHMSASNVTLLTPVLRSTTMPSFCFHFSTPVKFSEFSQIFSKSTDLFYSRLSHFKRYSTFDLPLRLTTTFLHSWKTIKCYWVCYRQNATTVDRKLPASLNGNREVLCDGAVFIIQIKWVWGTRSIELWCKTEGIEWERIV